MFLRHRLINSRRYLFKKIKLAPFKVESDKGHHEYSITPETFAFKVSGDSISKEKASRESKSSTENDKDLRFPPSDSTHPLLRETGDKKVNLIEAIYKNATNYPFEKQTPQDVFQSYPTTTSARMANSKKRPHRTKMLVSDFIEDSLYNPNYGYFSKEVEIFHTEKPFDYNNFEDADEFMDSWKAAYLKYDEAKKTEESPFQDFHNKSAPPIEDSGKTKPETRLAKYAQTVQKQDMVAAGLFPQSKKSLQLWHTPTELFSPFYGEALARYILVNYKLNGCYPYEDLIIYEMGGGNGTLMCNILNYIKNTEPDIYNRTQYKIIEITSQLALKQLSLALNQKLVSRGLDTNKLEIYNKSIFDWDITVEDHCFFIALEVFDNFSHDLVRYDANTGVPYEGHVLVDKLGDFYQFYTPELSYHTDLYLRLRENGAYPILPQTQSFGGRLKQLASMIPFTRKVDNIHPLLHSPTKIAWQNKLFPLKDNLTPGEFIPTRLLQFFRILKHRFPEHSLICSDFHSFSNTIPGYYNAPVVQTVLKDRMVDVSTFMCHQGYFDIMFATDFNQARDLYRQVTGKLAKVEHHREFLEQWADVEATTTKKGENPMLEFYKNVSFMVS
ncbi:hypothetical protein PUMCH_001047 [Australozyma saopauloensis]|uniref:type II protein arginine methyltransferase n=1 Tax=Australozyma saopauloensis TaxID=291208 RepID=A0AAX4H5E1_9ASCO|nr:hypothetical protein PUMCH_001047 [[Candida] saopauloensis]